MTNQSAEDLWKSGEEKFSNEDYEGAIKEYSKAIGIDPLDNELFTKSLYARRGEAKSLMGDSYEAIVDLRKGMIVDVEAEYILEIYELGQSSLEQEKYQDAIDKFTQAIESRNKNLPIHPSYERVFFKRGIARGLIGDLKGSDEDLKEASKLGNVGADEILQKESEQEWQVGREKEESGDIDGAIEQYSLAIDIYPKNIFALNSRGSVKSNILSEFNEAIKDFDKA